MTPNFFQAATLNKIGVESTLKKSQVAPYKILGRFYRVPIKSLLRVQIKRAIVVETFLNRISKFVVGRNAALKNDLQNQPRNNPVILNLHTTIFSFIGGDHQGRRGNRSHINRQGNARWRSRPIGYIIPIY